MSMANINSQWFIDRLNERQLSQRSLARLMGLDPSAVSLMMRGKRKITLEEAAQMAVLLNVNTNDVLAQAGVPVQTDERRIKVIGHVAPTGNVILEAKGLHEITTGPSDLPPDAVAIQCRTANSSADYMDGWMFFTSDRHDNPAAALDMMTFCAVKGNGMLIASIKRGYRRGTFNLHQMCGLPPKENVELAWATPIWWIRTTVAN